ncbi:putative baseplate assembly protein [Paenibacillus campi]|uniref:putative baseplate assembly protein n=1 Tax=Paenibacillus campi TaxID=3106031 RepID=UPI002AFEA7AC|nr:putative baseplate assembly protein [Paenibacillus sp. SGZ-1009]
MLPNLNLDDRTYAQIMERARQAIHRYSPEWTDENEHDPGITMLEMFSWLTEAQQYYINRVTARNELKFLQLLGVEPQQATCAETDVQFTGVKQQRLLPTGTRLRADTIVFETQSPLWLLPHQIERVVVQHDNTSVMHAWEGLRSPEFALFGADGKAGNCFCIGFDMPLPVNQPLHLTFDLVSKNRFPRNPIDPQAVHTPLAVLKWEFYRDGQWQEIELRQDTTFELTFDGDLRMTIPGVMTPYALYPATDRPRCWLRCTLVESGYETPPVLRHLLLNTVRAREGNGTVVCTQTNWDGEGIPVLYWSHQLAHPGMMEVRVYEQDGWYMWQAVDDLALCGPNDRCYVLTEYPAESKVSVYFGDGRHGRSLPAGTNHILFVAWEQGWQQRRYAGTGTGMPDQRYRVATPEESLCLLRIQTATADTDGKLVKWHEWTRVANFDSSGPDDRHFYYDERTGEIVFGDNRHGRAAERANRPNIVMIARTSGGGERGNVRSGVLRLEEDDAQSPSLRASNYTHGRGGHGTETLAAAKRRLAGNLHEVERAVTAEDYETIALRTPGLRVGRVKALPLYVSGLGGYPQRKAPGQMTLVVVPYTEQRKLDPSPLFLQAVRRYMDRYRMLGTELHVIGPQYIQANVQARIVVEPQLKGRESIFLKALNDYFDPLGREREFGKTIRSGDLHNWLAHIPGVLYVSDLWVTAEGSGTVRDESGNIRILPHALTYAGEHEVQLFTASEIR